MHSIPNKLGGVIALILSNNYYNNIVIAPANTGKDNNNNIAVTNIDHTNNGILSMANPGALIFIIVVIKFIAPNINNWGL